MTEALVNKVFEEDKACRLEKEFNLHLYVNQEHIITYKTNLSLESFSKKMEDKSDFIQLDYLEVVRNASSYNQNKIVVYSNEIKTILLRKSIIVSYQIINNK